MVDKVSVNVIDLDNTLIPYDSFRLLVINEIKKINLTIISLTLLRILKINSSKVFKEKITRFFHDNKYEIFFKEFSDKLYIDVDKRVLKLINEHTKESTINILLSASPNFFVKHLIKRLNWQGSGSYIENDKFVHLYGENKIIWLTRFYKPEIFHFNFAISDSSSDNDLLVLFQERIKWKKI